MAHMFTAGLQTALLSASIAILESISTWSLRTSRWVSSSAHLGAKAVHVSAPAAIDAISRNDLGVLNIGGCSGHGSTDGEEDIAAFHTDDASLLSRVINLDCDELETQGGRGG